MSRVTPGLAVHSYPTKVEKLQAGVGSSNSSAAVCTIFQAGAAACRQNCPFAPQKARRSGVADENWELKSAATIPKLPVRIASQAAFWRFPTVQSRVSPSISE